jgi:hypothetical protein
MELVVERFGAAVAVGEINVSEIQSFRKILDSIFERSEREWVYLPIEGKWTLESDTATLESDEVPPEMEDAPDAGVPQFAKMHSLRQVVPVTTLQDVVENLRQQKPSATVDDMFAAFEYYYDYDAFVDLS